MPFQIEICVDTMQSALAAEKGGANRIELCSSLAEGGITPSAGLISAVKKAIKLPIHVLIRPRRGDFYYSDAEIAVMEHDITFCKELGVEGVVLGVLQQNGEVALEIMKKLIALAQPMSVTFHRAFDVTPDPFKALEDLLSLKVERLLTSGQQRSAEEGVDLICELVKKASDRIVIMPGGGINEQNIQKIRRKTGALEFHTSARIKKESPMHYKKEEALMAAPLSLSEYEIMETTEERVKTMREQLL